MFAICGPHWTSQIEFSVNIVKELSLRENSVEPLLENLREPQAEQFSFREILNFDR